MTAPAQLALDVPLAEPEFEPRLSIEERWERFTAANPHFMDALEELADEWLSGNRRRTGTKFLFEILRYRTGIRTDDGSGWKVNNDYSALAARALLARRPDFTGRIEVRQLAKERHP